MGAVSAGEEFFQYGSEGVRGNIVCLTFQGTVLRIGEGVCGRLRGIMHERWTRSTVHYKRGYRDG